MQYVIILRGSAILIGLIAGIASALAQDTSTTINADVWADNWFALYVDGELMAEDSVSIDTEMSFNAESFSFTATLPVQIAVVVKDFIENDSGLEYIGRRRQQMGDGGFIAQFIDAGDGSLLGATSETWRCKAIHQAPLNRACERSSNPEQECQSRIQEEPENWASSDFDDTDWPSAIEHSASRVRPHGGYTQISWQAAARLIWTEDLEVDNTLLCRFTLAGG